MLTQQVDPARCAGYRLWSLSKTPGEQAGEVVDEGMVYSWHFQSSRKVLGKLYIMPQTYNLSPRHWHDIPIE